MRSETGSNVGGNGISSGSRGNSGTQSSSTFWRANDFGDAIKSEATSAANMNIFPVAFNLADFTSSLAQRGSELKLF